MKEHLYFFQQCPRVPSSLCVRPRSTGSPERVCLVRVEKGIALILAFCFSVDFSKSSKVFVSIYNAASLIRAFLSVYITFSSRSLPRQVHLIFVYLVKFFTMFNTILLFSVSPVRTMSSQFRTIVAHLIVPLISSRLV